MTRRTLIAGAGTLAAGRLTSQALALVRHVVIARLLSPEDLGVAALLMLTAALLELATQFSVDRLLVQARDGDDPRLQHASHQFLTLRGLAAALAVLACAIPLARAFSVPHAAWAFAAFALTPAIAGLRHLDSRRFHREARFAPDMGVEVASQLLVTALAWPMLHWVGGYAAVLWLLVARSAAIVIASHLVAQRPYRWAWDPALIRRILAFGWPLLAAGSVMFLVLQGDQFVVASGYSMHQLGLYAVAATLTLAIATLVSSISSTLLLPAMSRLRDDPHAFARAADRATLAHAAVGGTIGATLVLASPSLVTTLYGGQYADAASLVAWLGVMQCARLLRVTPTVAALARGDTITSLTTNLWRVSVLPIAAILAWHARPVEWIVIVGVAGEALALVAVTWRVRRLHALPVTAPALSSAACAAVIALAALASSALEPLAAATVALPAAFLLFAAATALLLRPARPKRSEPPATFALRAGEAMG